jgi:hypothetical protein
MLTFSGFAYFNGTAKLDHSSKQIMFGELIETSKNNNGSPVTPPDQGATLRFDGFEPGPCDNLGGICMEAF